MEEKKKMGNAKLLIMALVITLAVVLGTTYAWLRLTKNSDVVNKITAGNLELTLDDTTSEGIKLLKEIPRSYRQGMTTKEYTFTLTNKSSTSSYTLSLKDLTTYRNDEDQEVTIADEDRLADSKIRYILLKDGEEATAAKSNILTDRVIDAGTIEKGKTITYSLRIWIDSKAGDNNTEEEIMGKVFNAQLSLEATQKAKVKMVDFKIGDYVNMIPTSTEYIVPSNVTGYSSDQTINPSELSLWRVININDNDTIDLVSEYVSSASVYFDGKIGYQNSISVLNKIASQYTNSKYTVASRHMGYSNQTEKIIDTSALDSTSSPWSNNTSSSTTSSDEVKGGGDMGYERDCNLVRNSVGTLVANNVETMQRTPYWLASRNYNYGTSTGWRFGIRYIHQGDDMDTNFIYFYSDGNFEGILYYYDIRSVRPIVTIKAGLLPNGSGTSDDPYILD